MTLWDRGNRVDPAVLAFSAGSEYLLDDRLVPCDCRASMAHARMLGTIGMLEQDEVDSLVTGLGEIIRLHAEGSFVIEPEQEDCHTAIEEWLTEQVGEPGRKIHLGRSRNDQVLTALRLYEKEALQATRSLLTGLRDVLMDHASRLASTVMPGYTHMRRAMPTTAGTWLGAFAGLAGDSLTHLDTVYGLVDRSPLGTGAGYGIPLLEIDRAMTAAELGFASVQENPVHVQLCRGFEEGCVLDLMTSIMYGLNRLASDILLFSMPEFGFISLPESLCTGSSIMPQKRNPDILELVRAKYHVVMAAEFQARSVPGNLMTGYQRDLGMTKEPLFRGLDITHDCLSIMRLVVEGMEVDEAACGRAVTEELFATEEAMRLVMGGMAFRDAYRQVGERYSREGESNRREDHSGNPGSDDVNGG
ncbi:argininosuccinate lyase [Gemmatimonadota bacterium]